MMESNKTLSSEDTKEIIVDQPKSLNKTENSGQTFKSEATGSKSKNIEVNPPSENPTDQKNCCDKCSDSCYDYCIHHTLCCEYLVAIFFRL